ncbi:15779_t:CDS:1, partial [Dentiscutata erythropus]
VVKLIEDFFSVEQVKNDIEYTNLKFDEFKLEEFGIVGKNVSIEKIIIKNNQ